MIVCPLVTGIYLEQNAQHETVIPVAAKGMTLCNSWDVITVDVV